MKIKSKKGMTLIELIISLALLAIILIPVSNLAINSIKNTVMSEERQQAIFIGQKFLEELTAYDEIALSQFTAADDNEIGLEENEETKIRGFKLLDGDFIEEVGELYEGNLKKGIYDVQITIKKDKNFNKNPINNLNNLSNGKSLIFTLEDSKVTSSERIESSEEIKFGNLDVDYYDSNIYISLNYAFYEEEEEEEEELEDESEDELGLDNGEEGIVEEELDLGNEEEGMEEEGLDIKKGYYNYDELEVTIKPYNDPENNFNFKVDKKDIIIIYLGENFKNDIEIEIENNTNDLKNIYLIRDNKSTGKASLYSKAGRVILNKERKLLEEDLEDKYLMEVKVEKDGKILFEGESSNNLIIR